MSPASGLTPRCGSAGVPTSVRASTNPHTGTYARDHCTELKYVFVSAD
jgi:hypothetical protein